MQILKEGDRVKAKIPFLEGETTIDAMEEGTVHAVGAAWDLPIEVLYVEIHFDSGKKITIPHARAQFLVVPL
jgi:hypothetical protein